MSRHQTLPVRKTTVVRRAGAGHAEGLDAWLGAESRPGDVLGTVRDVSGMASVGESADWSAPSQPVDLAYDTASDTAGQRPPVDGLLSAVRAVVQEGSRRLMFEADAYEILLRVAANRQTHVYDLAGQVLYEGLPLPGVRVRLDEGGSASTTSTDGAGSFRLPPLMHGAYALRIAVEGAVLTTPPIALG
jgi:hypothetical protein